MYVNQTGRNKGVPELLEALLALTSISIDLLVVYREFVNLIGYITRLSADSLRQDSCSRDCKRDPLSNLNQYTWREWRATFEPDET